MASSRPMLAEYARHGWALVPIPAGRKGPTTPKWNTRELCITEPEVAEWLDGNVGLAHAYSGTCALDIDDLARATPWLAERGINLHELLTASDSVRIESRAGRAKLLYRTPSPLPTYQFGPIEFRCAASTGLTVQDVLPPSIHPDTKLPYSWRYGSKDGHWSKVPPLPPKLMDLWRSLGAVTAPKEAKATGAKAGRPSQRPTLLPKLREALDNWNPDASYEDWIKVGMALHYETEGTSGGLALWNEWSAKGQKYKGLGDLQAHWRSFAVDHNNPITLRSLRVDTVATTDEFADITQGTPAVIPPPDTDREIALAAIRALPRARSGRIEARISSIVTVLGFAELCGQRLALDAFMDAIVIAPRDTEDWRPFKDTDYTALRAFLETQGNCEPVSHEMVQKAVHLVASQHVTDSARNWLNTLQWDGKPRVDRFAPEYLGTEDAEYERAVGRYLWTALAGRVIDPGCQADMVPVIIGYQGVGKSRGVQAMSPSMEQFAEIRLDVDDDTIARKIRGKLIVEMAEMRGVRTAEVEKLKAFVTRTHEEWVPKYMEFTTRYPRRFIIVGTTNDDEFLPLDTEHRRWLPITTNQVHVEEIRRDRDQLWAEAAMLYIVDGIHWRGMDKLAAPARADAQGTDNWEPLILDWTSKNYAPHLRMHMILTTAIGLDPRTINRTHELRAAKVMRKLGWHRTTVREGNQVYKAWTVDPWA